MLLIGIRRYSPLANTAASVGIRLWRIQVFAKGKYPQVFAKVKYPRVFARGKYPQVFAKGEYLRVTQLLYNFFWQGWQFPSIG